MQTILHRINWNVVGGTETLFAEFLRSEADNGERTHDVLLLDQPHPFYRDAAAAGSRHLISRKRGAGGVKIPRWPPALRLEHVRKAVDGADPDLFVSWDCFANRELVGLVRRRGRPLIYQEQGSAWTAPDDEHAVPDFLETMSGALCNTNAAKRMLQLRWGYEGPARVNLNGLRPVVTESQPPHRAFPEGRRIKLGMMCRLIPVKGVPLALHAVRQLVDDGLDVTLDIAGDGREGARYRALAERLGVADRVQWLGLLEDVVAFFDSIDLLIAPSLFESFGLVSIEAEARGCPVVIAGVDGLSETVDDGRTGYRLWPERELAEYPAFDGDPGPVPAIGYDPRGDRIWEPHFVDPSAIASAVARIFEHPGEYERMSAQAARWSRQTFSFENFVARLLDGIKDFT